MGKYNSSLYRVRPLMEQIENDYNGFLSFIGLVGIERLTKPLIYRYEGVACKEMPLKPTKRHLLELIDYMATKQHKPSKAGGDRRRLFFGAPSERCSACEKAKALMEEYYDSLQPNSRPWYMFEGYTNPDIFIEGKDYVIVCEGKWTEPHITTTTTHLCAPDEYRNQIVRHIQGAMNYTKKKVFAFYIVDENCGYTKDLTKESLKAQLDLETIQPTDDEKAAIQEAFYGYTTWQDIARILPQVVFKDKKTIT